MFFFFNDTATTEIYTLSLHDALPISGGSGGEALGLRLDRKGGVAVERLGFVGLGAMGSPMAMRLADAGLDRKSTRLNSSHANISYAVFCLKKKNKKQYLYKCIILYTI